MKKGKKKTKTVSKSKKEKKVKLQIKQIIQNTKKINTLCGEEINEINDLINTYNNNTFCFSKDEEDLGFEVIEKRINETNKINNENITYEEKGKRKIMEEIMIMQ